MTTELRRFKDAYATMTIAAYEPLILRWISRIGIRFVSNAIADRLPKAKALRFDGRTPAGLALSHTLRDTLPATLDVQLAGRETRVPIDVYGRALEAGQVTRVNVPGYPNAVAVGNDVYLHGLSLTDPSRLGGSPDGAPRTASSHALKTIPLTTSRRLGVRPADFDFVGTRNIIEQGLTHAAVQWTRDPTRNLLELVETATKVGDTVIPCLWPGATSIQEALSPIGVAHYLRQLYFNKEEGVGPIEEAFTVAPLETLEVVYETVRKQIHEEVLEQGLEVVSESAVEQKNLDEVSDKVSSMVQQDTSASMSASASGGIGVWEVGATASADFSLSSQRSREYSTRRLKEVTKRASERVTKSFSLKTRDVTETTSTNMTRRVIRNDADQPVSYGLRRVLRRVNVKVQDLGSTLVWQIYLRNPGEGLAVSRFVHFRESAPIAVPDIPPGVPPRPAGGVESETATTALKWKSLPSGESTWYVTLVIKPGADRDVTGVRIDSITDLEGGGKDDPAPSPRNELDLGSGWDPATRTYTADIAVKAGDATSVQVTYSYTWDPSAAVLAVWEAQRVAAVAAATEELLTKQFEQQKLLITQRSKIKSRPANDLRREERYEVLNRMVSYLFGRGDDPSEPTPVEIEYMHRYFDIDALFSYAHPSWWQPRFATKSMGIKREAYEITAESEPAPLGSSLGWMIQLDGDRRRNEFLNSPWARVCVPIKRGREREAIAWLAKHLEGEIGYDPTVEPLSKLLGDVEAYRSREELLGPNGPDYVTVDSTPGAPADPARPEGVYPVIDEFDVTMPTDGFVYDELKLLP